jgi:hypothetical protein
MICDKCAENVCEVCGQVINSYSTPMPEVAGAIFLVGVLIVFCIALARIITW